MAQTKIRLFMFVAAVLFGVWAILHCRNWLHHDLCNWLSDVWDRLGATSQERESSSTTIRNVGLVAGAAVALLFAWLRIMAANRQADTAQNVLLNDQYQKGAEMLGSENLSVRLGGIYSLQRLAEKHPKKYHVQIMRLFCASVRGPTKDDGAESNADPIHSGPRLREDVQAIMTAIGTRSEADLDLEQTENFRLDLRDADLRGARLRNVNLSGAVLERAILSGADFWDANLSGANLHAADLTSPWVAGGMAKPPVPIIPSDLFTWMFGVNLSGATDLSLTKLRGVNLRKANLSGADLLVTNLTDSMLSGACLSKAKIINSNLSGSELLGAKLFETDLLGTNLSGADLYGAHPSQTTQHPVEGLTQAQLNQACADQNNPPKLDGFVMDAEKKDKPLVWHNRPCDDEA